MSEIESFAHLQRLVLLLQRVSQLSWTFNETKKRYPAPEAMTEEEVQTLTKAYLAMGVELEDIYKDWRKINAR